MTGHLGGQRMGRRVCVAGGASLYAAPHRSRIAQLVEQAAVNRWVVGSSPTPGAKFSNS